MVLVVVTAVVVGVKVKRNRSTQSTTPLKRQEGQRNDKIAAISYIPYCTPPSTILYCTPASPYPVLYSILPLFCTVLHPPPILYCTSSSPYPVLYSILPLFCTVLHPPPILYCTSSSPILYCNPPPIILTTRHQTAAVSNLKHYKCIMIPVMYSGCMGTSLRVFLSSRISLLSRVLQTRTTTSVRD